MKLSKKSDYALRAIFHMTSIEKDTPISIRELARQNDIPRRFLENIMLELKEAGVVRSIAGRDGGYVLEKPADSLTMGEIVRRFDGILAPIGCVSVSDHEPCSQEGRCRFRRILLEIRDYTARRMDGVTIASIMSYEPVSRAEIFSDELIEGLGI